MKKFCVYLDESGDFDKDLDSGKKRSGSLVGGVFWAKSDVNVNALFNKINQLTAGENHATDLKGPEKGIWVHNLISGVCTSFPIMPVIFQNDIKKRIINSTQTYLTVITEGLIQLAKTLVVQENDLIELEVIAGFKKDTTIPVTNSQVTGYISLPEYKERLEEKLAIEKAKLKSEKLQKSRINITLKDDKKDQALILCDSVCNFWYTKGGSSAFKGTISIQGKETVVRNAIEQYYKSEYIFSLFSTEEDEHIQRLIREESYADALFEGCSGILSEKNYSLLKKSFLTLRPKQINTQLENLADNIGNLIAFDYPGNSVENVLDNAQELCDYLTSKGIMVKKFSLDVSMYRLAFLNHLGRFAEMEKIFKDTEKDIVAHTTNNLDFEYLMIYYIRKAVYLLDLHRYKDSSKICDDLELLLDMIGEALRSNDCITLDDEFKSEHLGKVLGTKLQVQICQCLLGQDDYELAKETSDNAINNFIYASDLKRQYQYRAELEAVCGHADEAMVWIEKSFGGLKWDSYISGSDRNNYDIYNLLYIAAALNEINHSLSIRIAEKVEDFLPKEMVNLNAIEIHCFVFLGYIFFTDKRYKERGKKYIIKEMDILGDRKESHEYHACEANLRGENGFIELFRGE